MKNGVEFYPRRRSDVRPKIGDNELAAKLFLQHISSMTPTDSIFFKAETDEIAKRISSRIRTRLWRYAESGYIKHREFSVWKVEGGFSLVRNSIPTENFKKRNIKTRKGG